MKKVWLIIGASMRSQLRWARQHLYTWLILAPLILGITYLTASRLVRNLSIADISFLQLTVVGAALFIGLLGLSLSRASAELYHQKRPAAYFEALPVAAHTHLHAALLTRCGRTLVVGFFLVAIKVILQEPLNPAAILALTLFVMLTSVAEVFAALQWIHWSHKRRKRFALLSILLIAVASQYAGSLFAGIFKSLETGYSSQFRVILPGLAGIILLYVITRFAHQRMRASDVEHARRIEAAGRLHFFSVAFFRRRFQPTVAAQLARDFQLTWRGFSSAVYVIALLVPLLLATLVAALTTHFLPPVGRASAWLDAMQLPQVSAVKITSAIITATLASLTPVLVAYELPHLWLERATGASGLDLWQAKISYARFISVSAPFLAFLCGASFGGVPLFYLLPLLVECLMLWWAISSLIGALSFEMPTRPGLALIVMATVGIGAGLGASFGLLTSAFLPLGVMFYAQAMHGLTDRGRARARYYLLYGED
ncbi:MAG: hypothetical protein HY231_01765 [Acidobacteria bacterium]|nr:hypothetical protein [Acidobacteriota bacterium]